MTRIKILFLSLLAVGALMAAGMFLFFGAAQQKSPRDTAESPSTKQIIIAPHNEIAQTSAVNYAKILEKLKGKDVTEASVNERLIALTFDGGGNSDSAKKIIQTLSDNGIRATFFLTGNFIEKFPDSAELIIQGGGEVANHTMTHKNFSEISDEEAIAEINGMERAAEALGIHVVPFFRFPYGAPTKEKIALVNGLGYASVRWTVDSLGWQGKKDGRDAQFVAARVIGKAKPGAIALMHLGSANDTSTLDAEALPEIIAVLREEGYRFVSLSELFSEIAQ